MNILDNTVPLRPLHAHEQFRGGDGLNNMYVQVHNPNYNPPAQTLTTTTTGNTTGTIMWPSTSTVPYTPYEPLPPELGGGEYALYPDYKDLLIGSLQEEVKTLKARVEFGEFFEAALERFRAAYLNDFRC